MWLGGRNRGFAYKVYQRRWQENGGQWDGDSIWVSGSVLMGPEAALQTDGCLDVVLTVELADK